MIFVGEHLAFLLRWNYAKFRLYSYIQCERDVVTIQIILMRHTSACTKWKTLSIWRPVGRWVDFSAKKSLDFSCSSLFQRGCCLLKVPWKTRKIDDLSKLKFHKLSKLSDRQIWKTQDWKRQLDERSKLFFLPFFVYRRTFWPGVVF